MPPGKTYRLVAIAGVIFLPLAMVLAIPVFCFSGLKIFVKRLRLPDSSLGRDVLSFRGFCLKFIAGLRYKLNIEELDKVNGNGPFLFLANHPSLLDPLILYSCLDGLRPRFIADENQFTSSLLRGVKNLTSSITIPDYAISGPKARAGLLSGLEEAGRSLASGKCVVLYPAGAMQKTQPQKLNNNSSVCRILQIAPETRIIAVRTSGMWGSSFSKAAHNGNRPDFMSMLCRGVTIVFGNLLLFTPRRQLTLHFEEVDAATAKIASATGAAERRKFTGWLEEYFNYGCTPARAVPCYFWQGTKPVEYEVGDPEKGRG